jgi:transcription elongation factor GreB
MADQPAKRAPPPNYITPTGYKRLADELTFLHTKKRPEVVSALADAAAEAIARRTPSTSIASASCAIDRRMRFLSKRLDDVRIVDPRAAPPDQVFFGATVTVEDAEGERPTESSVSTRPTAPRATSLAIAGGASAARQVVGDTVTVRWHAGLRELTVAEIDYR